MATQTAADYQNMRPGFPGMLSSEPIRAKTGRNNTATPIPAGRFVAFDPGTSTTENAVKLPDGSGVKILGPVVMDQAREGLTYGGSGIAGVPQNGMLTVLNEGTIYVECEETLIPSDPIYVRYASGAGGTGLGRVRNDADTATAVLLGNVRMVRMIEAVSSGVGLVELAVNLP